MNFAKLVITCFLLSLAGAPLGCSKGVKFRGGAGEPGAGGEAGAPATGGTGGASSGAGGGSAGTTTSAGSGGAATSGGAECVISERRCSGQTPERCSEAGDWVPSQAACAISCFDGECGECVEGTTDCRNGAVVACKQGQWETEEVCANVCEVSGVAACVSSCTEGRHQCNGERNRQVCSDGEFVDDMECEFLCQMGECTGQCMPDAKRCNPDARNESQSCNAQGQWGDSVECGTDFCVTGDCKPCEPGTQRCASAGPQTCGEAGEWVPQGACADPTPVCSQGQCTTCSPGARRCSGNQVEECSSDGGVWQLVETCSGETPACLESTTACGKCQADDVQCSGDTVQTCNDMGAWDDTTDCGGSTPQCVAGACAACDPDVGQRRCQNQTTAQACAADGTWGMTTSCTGNTPRCRDDLNFSCGCIEGERRCQGSTVPEICQGGAWVAQAACAGTFDYCLAATGQCVDCQPGDQDCNAGGAIECDPQGSWQSLGSCAGSKVNCGGCDLGEPCNVDDDCLGGACVNSICAVCKPGATQCTGNSLSTCGASGQWGAPVACTNLTCLVQSGTASCTGECAPNQQRCSGNVVQSCNSVGAWASSSNCTPLNLTCSKQGNLASCGGNCAPSQQRCSNNVIQNCNQGAWTNSSTDCTSSNETCVASGGGAQCQGSCAPSQQRCNSNRVQNCDAGGNWVNAAGNCTNSNSTCVENGTAASCSGECVAGRQQCNGNVVQTCSANGLWEDTNNCTPSNTTCSESGNTASCGGNCAPGQMQSCGTTCNPGTQTCSGGAFGNCVVEYPPSCDASPTCSSVDESCCRADYVTGATYTRSTGYNATVSSFCMDTYEVTVGRFREFVADYDSFTPATGAGVHQPGADSGWQSSWGKGDELPTNAAALRTSLRGVPGLCDIQGTWRDNVGTASAERLPINCINWYTAFAFCIWDGGRLATEAEWELAAGLGQNYSYPWGSASPTNNLALYDGCGADNSCGSYEYSDILPVGSRRSGAGFYGHMDLGGSMAEWNFDYALAGSSPDYPTTCNNCAVASSPGITARAWAGGGWSLGASYLQNALRFDQDPSTLYSLSGIRCVRTP